MDESYDYIVCGTGLVECILSCILSQLKYKVLHIDRNDYYGGEGASLNLTQLYQRFRGLDVNPPSELGRDRDYNIDLIPKFTMSSGGLIELLTATQVTRYIQFDQIDAAYVYKNGRIDKVPSTPTEAISSSAIRFFEKHKTKKFLEFIQNYDQSNPKTYSGYDLTKITMKQLYDGFGLDQGTQDFIGHGMCLHIDDTYTNQSAYSSYKALLLYYNSLQRFGKSPYIYPLYGLSELPQGFARLSSVYGGTYMLNTPFDGLEHEADPPNKVRGVKSGSNLIQCKGVIGDPSYFPNKVTRTAQVIRAICILKAPIPNTNSSNSVQIIIPQRQINRKYDIYIACVSSSQNVCAKGFYIAIVSTIIETTNPELEIVPGLSLLGPIVDKFISVSDIYHPNEDGTKNNVFISKSYDASSHFESLYEDVKSLYQRITDKELDLQDLISIQKQASQSE